MAEARRKIIIVCDDKCKKYGEFLLQLISSDGVFGGREVGPKAGEVQAVVWTEKDYQGNSAKISSDQYVVFVGNGKVAKGQKTHMISQFSYYGMNYGWLGKKAALSVDESMNKVSEYKEFYDFILKYKPETVSLIEEKNDDKDSVPLIGENVENEAESFIEESEVKGIELSAEDDKTEIMLDDKLKKKANKFWVGIGNVVDKAKIIQKSTQERLDDTLGGGNLIKFGKIKGKLNEQQYDCLILAFYQKGMKEFLGL